MTILKPDIEKYLADFPPVNEPVIREMEEYGRERDFPLVGPQVGALLTILTRATGAKNILELGSGFGYSAAWFFLGTLTDGRIVCTEFSEENIERGRDYLTRLGAVGNVDWRRGDALETLEELDGPFDVVFCDVDKHAYPEAFEKSLPKLKRNGLFICDNVLWKGKVADVFAGDDNTAAIREFNRKIYETSGVISSIVPIRDGVSVSLKT